MRVANRSVFVENDSTMWAGAGHSQSVDLDVVLKPLSRPDLGEIRLDDAELAIGRTDQPFASYGKDILERLSRRHARIFRQEGLVCLSDLQSRNGTSVNGVGVGQVPCQLRDGDEVCFGGVLSYRVQITPRPPRLEGSLTLKLTPKSGKSGLDTIVIREFPFLIGKSEATFARYDSEHPHRREWSFLSRRHASIYEDRGQAYIEDLGSSNGTFVDGVRSARAVALANGAEVAFGGGHFAYRVSIIAPPSAIDPTHVIGREPPVESGPDVRQSANDGRTRFMAAPTGFLELFHGADEAKRNVAPGGSANVPVVVGKELAVKRRPRGRALLLFSELAQLLAGAAPSGARRSWWRAAAVAGLLGAVSLTAYLLSSPERALKNAVARGEYAQAAALAGQLLEKHPDDLKLKELATETALKALVPVWLAKVRAGDFDGAKGTLTGKSELRLRDADLRPLIGELEWLGSLERLVSVRGGPEAPIRIYADEADIEHVIERWNDDTGEHQRALARIASYVPQFGDWYGDALTHLRKLQSESAVYLPVIDQLKANITLELARDNPAALEPVLKEATQKYPAIGGLDSVRQDLAHYLDIRGEARTRKSGRLFALLQRAHFVTPPFEQSLHALIASGRLPSAERLQEYDAVTQSWKDGNASEALAGLQRMTAGPWGDEATLELARRRGVTAQFTELQESRNDAGFVDRLLAFRESLDADEDSYFARATAADLDQHRDDAIARAQETLNRASASWEEYQSIGAIDASQRVEISISDQFRTRARLLAEASRDVQQGCLIYSQVDPSAAKQWTAIRDEIESEARQQRSLLHALGNVIEPELLKTKLALLGEASE